MNHLLTGFFALATLQLAVGERIDSLRNIASGVGRPAGHTLTSRYGACLKLADEYRWGNRLTPANIDSAAYFLSEAIRLAPDRRRRADAIRLRGDLYSNSEWGGYTGAWAGLDDLNEAARLYIDLRDSLGLRLTYNTLSVLYLTRYNLQSMPSANTLYYRTLALRVQSDPTFTFPKWLQASPSDSAASPAQFREAIRVGEQNLQFWLRRHSKPHRMWRLEYLGGLYRQSGIDRAKGIVYQREAAQLARELNDFHILFACLTNLAQWEMDDGHYTVSLQYAREGLQLAQHQQLVFRQATFHDRLYYTFRAIGQMDSSYAHKDASIALNDSLARMGDRRQIQYLKDKYIAEKRQHELEQTLQQRSQWLYRLVGLGALLVGGIFVFGWRNRLLNRQNDDLKAALLRGQTLERQRVAADLHDNLGSTLTALRWNLDSLHPDQLSPAEQQVYAAISQQLDQAYRDVRLLSHNLLPDELANQGLPTALKLLVDKLNRNKTVQFSLIGIDSLPRLDPQVEFEVYSVCLELTNNILKHAHATQALIRVRVQNELVLLSISDDGVGLAEQARNGQGLKNIADRVASLGGQWQLESEPSLGVRHQISFPIKTPIRASSRI